jgi:hypothetical protein
MEAGVVVHTEDVLFKDWRETPRRGTLRRSASILKI